MRILQNAQKTLQKVLLSITAGKRKEKETEKKKGERRAVKINMDIGVGCSLNTTCHRGIQLITCRDRFTFCRLDAAAGVTDTAGKLLRPS